MKPVHLSLLSLLSLLSFGVPLQAQTAADLRNLGRQAASDIASLKSSGRFDTAAQRSATERVGKGVLQYIELCDKASSAGAEKRDGEALRGAFEALKEPLTLVHDASGGAMEKLEQKIIEEDGDLEALYESADFKTARITGSQALYYLNWLHYYGGRLYEGAKRKELLEKAQKGFSEFTSGDKRSELLLESLLGRGLTALELKDIDAAEQDLKAIIKDEQAGAERRAKARLALLDAYVRNDRPGDAIKLAEQIAAAGGEDNVVRFLRARALLDAAKKAPAADAARYRQQAMTAMESLRRAGGVWEERAAALLASVENPEQLAGGANSPVAKWQLARMLLQKNDFKQAAPLLESVVTSNDAALKPFQGEARYYLGVGKFQAGELAEAAELFDAALTSDKASYAADAAYLRFKAVEGMLAKDPASVTPERYEIAVRAFAAHEEHKSAFEAHFRLGELLQRQRQFGPAIESYAKVVGDPAFELRARFATLQCHFELLQEAAPGTPPPQRAAWMKAIEEGLEQFPKLAAEYEKRGGKSDSVPLAQMRGKWAILRAAFDSIQAQPDHARIAVTLDGFEKQYPDLQDLLPQVVKLRLLALQQLGRFPEATAEVKRHAGLLAAHNEPRVIEEMAGGFIRAGANRKNSEGAEAYTNAEQTALALYELLIGGSETGVKTKLTLGRLYENTGELDKSAALYRECLEANPGLLPAMRGLARIAEAQQRLPEALAQWQSFTKTTRGGDLTWYEGNYETARLTEATGHKKEACNQLDQLKPAMPGLTDADLRAKLNQLYEKACR